MNKTIDLRSAGIFGNVLCSPRFYRPSTFGGRLGWDIVHTATLKRLICANIPGGLERCPHVGFSVPDHRPPVGLFDPGIKPLIASNIPQSAYQ